MPSQDQLQAPPSRRSRRWAQQEEVNTPEKARAVIDAFWMPAVNECDFPDIQNRNQGNRKQGVENRRKILQALGERGKRDGTIRPVISLDEISSQTGINKAKVHKSLNLELEVRPHRFIRLIQPGKKANPKLKGPRYAAVYLLLVDKIRDSQVVNTWGEHIGVQEGNTSGEHKREHYTPRDTLEHPPAAAGVALEEERTPEHDQALSRVPDLSELPRQPWWCVECDREAIGFYDYRALCPEHGRQWLEDPSSLSKAASPRAGSPSEGGNGLSPSQAGSPQAPQAPEGAMHSEGGDTSLSQAGLPASGLEVPEDAQAQTSAPLSGPTYITGKPDPNCTSCKEWQEKGGNPQMKCPKCLSSGGRANDG